MSGLIPNHTDTRRKILFDAKNSVGIVRAAKRYGPEATTFQTVERTILYSVTSCPNDGIPVQNAVIHNGCKLIGHWTRSDYEMSYKDLKSRLEHVPEELLNYLAGEGNGLLPAGYGWDGKHTDKELARGGRIKQLIIGESDFKNITSEVIDIITEDALVSPSTDLMMSWDNAIPFEDVIPTPVINPESKLFVFLQNDDVSVRIDTEDKPTSITPDQQYDRVVVIVTKIHQSPRYPSFGISLQLYKRKQRDDDS